MQRWQPGMTACLLLVIQIAEVSAHNNDDEVPINDAQELVAWCQNEVEQLYLASDKIPRNWRVSHVKQGNFIKVKLKFRVEYEDKSAVCQVRQGAQRRYAIFKANVE